MKSKSIDPKLQYSHFLFSLKKKEIKNIYKTPSGKLKWFGQISTMVTVPKWTISFGSEGLYARRIIALTFRFLFNRYCSVLLYHVLLLLHVQERCNAVTFTQQRVFPQNLLSLMEVYLSRFLYQTTRSITQSQQCNLLRLSKIWVENPAL